MDLKKLRLAIAGMTVLLAACATMGTSVDTQRAAVDAFVTAWNTGDMSKLDASTTVDFKRTDPSGTPATSREAMKDVMKGLRAAYPDLRVVITDSRYAGDRVFLNWTATGTNTGPGEMPPTRKPVKVAGYTVMHFNGDRIRHEEVYFDRLSWMTQLGATIVPPGR